MVSQVASWAEHAIWWHVYPLGFTGAEKATLTADDPALVPAHSWVILSP